MVEKKKLRIGWFSFAGCEGSTIIFTELLNDHWQEWLKKIDFAHVNILKSKNELKDLDVAFVEGAIVTEKDKTKLKKIRKNCKYLIAIGSCAIIALPSGQRNNFNEKQLKEIEHILKQWQHLGKVLPLKDVVKVDDQVHGCPMIEKTFLEILDKYLKLFGVE